MGSVLGFEIFSSFIVYLTTVWWDSEWMNDHAVGFEFADWIETWKTRRRAG